MINKHCEWCDHQFETKIKYQIYCSPECREQATKEKILERYRNLRRNKDSYKNRTCKSCGNKLSVYNNEDICQTCSINPMDVSKVLKEMKRFGNGNTK